jgi:HEAT repeat protein
MRVASVSAALLALAFVTANGCAVAIVELADAKPFPAEPALDALASQLEQGRWQIDRHWVPQASNGTRQPSPSASDHLRWSLIAGPGQEPGVPQPGSDAQTANNRPAASGVDALIDEMDREPPAEDPREEGKNQTTDEAPTQPDDPQQGTNEPERAPAGDDIAEQSADSPAEQPEENSPATAESPTSPWNGFWPLGISQVLDRLDVGGNDRLVRENKQDKPLGQFCLVELAKRDDRVGWNAAIIWAQRNPAAAASAAPRLEHIITASRGASQSGAAKPSEQAKADESAEEPPPIWEKLWERFASEDDSALPEEPQKEPKRKSQEDEISPAMQAAAAEAWCRVLVQSSSSPLEALAPAGRLLERADLPDAVRGELFRGIARWVAPARIPRLDNALQESADNARAPVGIRRAAIEACLIHALTATQDPLATIQIEKPVTRSQFNSALWPDTIRACRFDPDTRIRATYGRWLAAAHQPEALTLLKAQLADREIRVREQALVSIGEVGTEEARNELRTRARHSGERIRLFAVKGLANWGVAELEPFVGDRSFHVRQTLAEQLSRYPSVEAALLLRELLGDASTQVQLATVGAIETWPDRLAEPLLLWGLRDSARSTRQKCSHQLQKRTGIDTAHVVDALATQRADAVLQMVRQHDLPLGYIEQLRQNGLRETARVNNLRHSEITAALNELASNLRQPPEDNERTSPLSQLTAADVGQLEKYVSAHPRAHPHKLYREILPRLSPVYAALLEMEEADVFAQRRGAARLSKLAAAGTLSAVAVRRLRQHLAKEQDQLVWRYAMAAVQRDATEEGAQVALLAINHKWSDIRQLGCRYVARHGRPQRAEWLRPLFVDSNTSVQLAAVEAAGACNNPTIIDDGDGEEGEPPSRGLRALLTHPQQRIRFACAVSMSQLGDSEGMQELIRMSFHESSTVRRQAVTQMGETGRARFVEHLIRLGWTETNAMVKRAILANLDRLTPPVKRPEGLLDAADFDAKIQLWAEWSAARRERIEPAAYPVAEPVRSPRSAVPRFAGSETKNIHLGNPQ